MAAIASRIEVELALLDPVLHLAAGAVDLLVKILGLALVPPQRGDHEARIGFPLRPLGLGDDPAPAAPGPARRPHEGLEAALRPAAAPALGGDEIKLGRNLGDQPLVARQPEQEVDAVALAPGHQVLPREAAVRAQQNACPRPAGADARDHARHLLDRAGRRIHVGAPQLGDQQVTAAEHVERQIAVAVVVAVEEPPLLLANTAISGSWRSSSWSLRSS